MNVHDLVTDEIVNQAQQAFWAKLIEIFPEVQSGDFPPLETLKFDEDCKSAIITWLNCNHPSVDDREFYCEDCGYEGYDPKTIMTDLPDLSYGEQKVCPECESSGIIFTNQV